MTAVEMRIRAIRIYEELKTLYDKGSKNVIKTGENSYAKIDKDGKILVQARGF